MAQIAPESLPPRAFRKNVNPPALLPRKPPKNITAKWTNKLAMRALLMEIAPRIVDIGREFHLRTTRDEVIRAQGQGYLKGEVAVVVDGSVNRPVGNVRFGGSIVYLDNPSNQQVVAEAAAFVFNYAFQTAKLYRKTGRHMSGFVVLVDGVEIGPGQILSYGDKPNWERMTVTNEIPYSAKLEVEYKQNQHMLWGAYKKARQAGYTKRTSMRFQIGAQDYAADDGGRIRRPEIVIQRLGAFISRSSRRDF